MKEYYDDSDETRYTCFDPPLFSQRDNPRDNDKPSPELLANPAYRNYGRGVLGGGAIESFHSNETRMMN